MDQRYRSKLPYDEFDGRFDQREINQIKHYVWKWRTFTSNVNRRQERIRASKRWYRKTYSVEKGEIHSKFGMQLTEHIHCFTERMCYGRIIKNDQIEERKNGIILWPKDKKWQRESIRHTYSQETIGSIIYQHEWISWYAGTSQPADYKSNSRKNEDQNYRQNDEMWALWRQ